MAKFYEGVIQQNRQDNFFTTKHKHALADSVCKVIRDNLCLKDPHNPHLGSSYWFQGDVVNGGLYSHLKCSIMDGNICDLAGEDPINSPKVLAFNPHWENTLCSDYHATGTSVAGQTGEGQVSCTWSKELFLKTPWIKAYTEQISVGGNQQSKIISSKGFKKDPNLDDMYTNYCTQKSITRAVLEPPASGGVETTTSSSTPLPPLTAANGTVLTIPQIPIDPLLQPIQQIDPNFECPPDTFLGTGERMASCSYFKTTDTKTASDSPQVLCNVWRKNGTLAVAEGAIKSYCDTQTTRDCLCLNPGIDPEVKILFDAIAEVEGEEGGLATSRGCWFLPCDSDSYLITSELEKEKANCDIATKCSQVINIANSKGINLNNIKLFLKCDLDGPPTPSNGGGTILGVSVDVFIIATILVVALIVIIFFVFYSGGTKNSDTK